MSHSPPGLIDAHLHLQMPALREHAEQIIAATRQAGITKLCVNGTSPDDWPAVAELTTRFSEIVPFFGIHPWKVNEVTTNSWEATLTKYLTQFPHAGVGEIGVDRWIRDHDIAKQKHLLLHQLDIAESFNRPAEIHCLRAWGHLREALDESSFRQPFLLHSYGGPVEMIDDFATRGAYFSLSGYFFRSDKTQKLDTFRHIPKDRLLLETDAPDMLPPTDLIAKPLPSPEESGINHPINLRSIYHAYAQWSKRDPDELATSLASNAARFLKEAN